MSAVTCTPELLKLAGMKYHGGCTIQSWIDRVGVDPSKVPGIEISKSGLCYWTRAAARAYDAHCAARKFDMDMLTGRLGV